MSDLDYDALRKVAEAATPGPWSAFKSGPVAAQPKSGGVWETVANTFPTGNGPKHNAAHIAAFDPPTVLRLLDLAQRAEADRAAVERAKALADEWSAPESHRAHAWLRERDAGDRLRAALDRKEDQ